MKIVPIERFAPPPPPEGLSDEAAGWWRRLQAAYELGDDGGQLLLQTALEAFDHMREAQRIVAAEGMVVRDRFGQGKPHPLLPVIRDSRSGLVHALKLLNLGLEALEDEGPRAAGRGGAA